MTTTVTEADPLWDVEVGLLDEEDYQKHFLESARGRSYCGVSGPEAGADNIVGRPGDGTWTCTRNTHPAEWRHIVTGGRTVICAWGGVDPALLTPEEPSDVDPDDVEEATLEVGVCYKFRNKRTALIYLGSRQDGKAEVFDLDHGRYRVLERKQLVPRRADAAPVPAEQVKVYTEFMVGQRNRARQTAVAQRVGGYFHSDAELDKVLVELDMEPSVKALSGTFAPQFQITTRGVDDESTAVRLLVEWVRSLPPLPVGFTVVEAPRSTTRGLGLSLRQQTT